MFVKQVTMISLEELMPEKHNYRKFKEVFNFRKIDYRLKGHRQVNENMDIVQPLPLNFMQQPSLA